jgi:hypothetical protein
VSRRRALLLGALALVVAVIAVWFAGRDRTRAPQASAPRAHDDGFARRLAAVHQASAKLAPALPRYQLRGRVVDGAGSPVAGAAVVVGAQQTKSGTSGEFTLTNLLPGRYSLEARKGPLVGGPLAVQLAGDREVTLVLRRGAELSVEVVSAQDQRPIANAEVNISLLSMYDRGGEQSARTDARGIATFQGVTLVAHNVWVAADGFAERSDTVDPMYVAGTALTFRIELTPGVNIRGRVVDAETGQPIANAAIESVAGDHREAPRRGEDRDRLGNAPPYAMEVRGQGVRSDHEGRFRIGVTKGPWTIIASHPTYATIGGFLVASDAALELQLSMTKGVVLRGVVVTESDLPVAGAEIEARWQHGGRVERTTQADGRGHFELSGLPAAPLEILARAADATSAPKRFDLSTSVPAEDVLLVLDNTGVITGRVTRGGTAVAGAQVFFVERNPRAKVHPGVVNCDDAGAFRITGVALDRTYSLNAMPHQDGDAWFRSGSAEANAGADVTIEIPADGKLRGRVDAGRVKLADIQVEIEGNTPPRPLDRDGKFAFVGIPPGSRTLRFSGPKIAEQRVTAEIHPGEDLDVGAIKIAAGRLVSGKVIDANERAIGDADLVVHAERSSELRTSTSTDGTFSLVAPAERELTIETRGRRGGFTRTSVPASGSSTGLVIKLAGNASVEGAITLGDDPVKGGLVELRSDKTSDRPYAYTETDASGYFKLQAIEPGSYDLRITRTDPNTALPIKYAQSIEVKAGANFANMDLKPLKPL